MIWLAGAAGAAAALLIGKIPPGATTQDRSSVTAPDASATAAAGTSPAPAPAPPSTPTPVQARTGRMGGCRECHQPPRSRATRTRTRVIHVRDHQVDAGVAGVRGGRRQGLCGEGAEEVATLPGGGAGRTAVPGGDLHGQPGTGGDLHGAQAG